MGAKLVAPLLLKSFEKLFDGPIKVLQSSFGLEQSPASWIDIVTFARSNSSEFFLTDTSPGVKSCRFWIKGGQVEISEDDYRLIVSGAPERMIPTQPIAEDESAELATLNILETRLTMLIKKADAVASKARQLNYHLKGRKTAFMARRAPEQSDTVDRTISPQPVSVNNSRSPAPQGSGDLGKIQQQLLEQFLIATPMSMSRRTSIAHSRSKTRMVNSVEPPPPTQIAGLTPTSITTFNAFNTSHPPEPNDRRLSQPNTATSSDDGIENHYRVVMATKIDKLAKGDVIFPPCDRCRRLKFDCIKHISACAGCTKKHARCSWKDIRDGELEYTIPPQIQQNQGIPQLQENGNYLPVNTNGSDTTGGVRSPLSGVGIQMSVEEERLYREGQKDQEGGDRAFGQGLRLNAEQALLSQIASAAATAGTR